MLKVIAALLLTVTSALAADLPARPLIKAPTVVLNDWQGLYFGIHGGYNLGSFNPIFNTGATTSTEVNLDDNSPFIGGHIGYNAQSGAFVIGPEFGVQYWGFKSRSDVVVGVETVATLQQEIDWIAYANVRLGITPFSSTLIYLTGGAAWAHTKGELLNVAALNTANEQSLLGWNIGAGIEFKITERITFGGEYRHYDFGNVTAINPALAVTLGTVDRLTVDQAMGRLSYRFY